MDMIKILSRDEIFAVLDDLKLRGRDSINAVQNQAIFRLSCCCGLRVKEIAGLNVDDIRAVGDRPHIHIRQEITKGQAGKKKARRVPLWWDSATREFLASWAAKRQKMFVAAGLEHPQPLICGLDTRYRGLRLTEDSIGRRWSTALRILGPARAHELSIHCGRHSFCSHALNVGRSIVEVRDAAGHSNISTTSIYLHLIDRPGLPDMFSSQAPPPVADVYGSRDIADPFLTHRSR